MRSRKFLLVTKALTTASIAVACKKEELASPAEAGNPYPANPKGAVYDEGMLPATPDAGAVPIGPPTITPVIPLPANPKGSHYDAPRPEPTTQPTTKRHPLPGNPKGTRYDGGLKDL